MSIAVLAQHMAAKGRHGDDMLVHMSKDEVAALQKLAKAHGTTLTINPETGLPEAFSLKQLLGIVAPLALNFILPGAGAAIGGALAPAASAATQAALGSAVFAGGLGTLATGSLSKGLMMGMSAYGMSGLGDALSSMGTNVGAEGLSNLNRATAASLQSGADQAIANLPQTPAVAPPTVTPPTITPPAAPSDIISGAMQRGYTPEGAIAPMPTAPAAGAAPTPIQAPAPAPMPSYYPNAQDIRLARGPIPASVTEALEKPAQAGFGALTQPGGMGKFVSALGGGLGAAKTVGMLAAPILLSGGKTKAVPTSSGNIQYYDFDNTTNQWTYLGAVPASEVNKAGGYEAGRALIGKAGGGIVALARGGVAHFDGGGWMDDFTPASEEERYDNGFFDAEGNFRSTAAAPAPAPAPAAPSGGIADIAPTAAATQAGTPAGPSREDLVQQGIANLNQRIADTDPNSPFVSGPGPATANYTYVADPLGRPGAGGMGGQALYTGLDASGTKPFTAPAADSGNYSLGFNGQPMYDPFHPPEYKGSTIAPIQPGETQGEYYYRLSQWMENDPAGKEYVAKQNQYERDSVKKAMGAALSDVGVTTPGTKTTTPAPASYNIPGGQGVVPLYGTPQTLNAPPPSKNDGPFVVGGTEPGYVAPPYDASKDPGNWYANPPAGPEFEKFKPGQETEQQYMARLGKYYESPEGQAYQAKQREAGYDATMRERAKYGLIDPNYDYGPGYGKGGKEWLARNPDVAVTPFDTWKPSKGGTAAPSPGPTTGPAPAPSPAPAPGPTPAPAPTPPLPGTTPAPPPGAPTIPTTPGLPPISPPIYGGGPGGTVGKPGLIKQAYRDFWTGTPVGTEIGWAGGKLKRISAVQAVYTGPDGKTITMAPGSNLNTIAANNPNIGELWREEFGLVPKNYNTGATADILAGLYGQGKIPVNQSGIIQDEYAAAALGLPRTGKYIPNYETGKMELNPNYREPRFPGLPGGTPNPNAPEGMQGAYDDYFAGSKVGQEIPFAKGKLKRVSDTAAIYTDSTGKQTYLYKNSRFDDIAKASPEIAELWKSQFGYEPGGTSSGGGSNEQIVTKKGGLLSLARGGMPSAVLAAAAAQGGISHLGDYSDGGRLLRGPGDGVSDDIPATIANKRPARLADGEFVVPARIVSELGNGSTEAGARKLYSMMDRVQANRRKTVGKGKVAVNSRADKYLPA